MILSNYLHTTLAGEDLIRVVERCVQIIENRRWNFDAIAFRGMSGALVAPSVAMMTGKNLIMVRKKKEKTHASHMIEGDVSTRKYIIIDDLVDKGNTLYNIVSSINDWKKELDPDTRVEDAPKLCGVLLYAQRHAYDIDKVEAKINSDREDDPVPFETFSVEANHPRYSWW